MALEVASTFQRFLQQWPPFPVTNRFVIGLLACLVMGFRISVVAALQPLPEIDPPESQLAHLKRTAAILHNATPTHRGQLKVLFYGQSITLEPWWQMVRNWFLQRFPNVDFIIENRAISGFQADKLAYTALADLVVTQPDLVILHDYGFANEMELLLQTIRKGCSAEVLLQTDHPHLPGQINEETDPAKVSPADWWAYRNAVTLPTLCQRYNYALADVRPYWKAYLKRYQRSEGSLLRDATHPNEDGNILLASAIIRYFEASPVDPLYQEDQNDTVRTLRLEPSALWPTQSIEVEFSGRRLEAVLSEGATAITQVRIDGSAPSKHDELVAFTRPSDTHNRPWPAFTLVGNRSPLLAELWTLTLNDVSPDGLQYTFRVEGSKTGLDGVGTNTKDFVSRSGRVVISKGSWWIPFAAKQSGTNPPVGFQVRWESKFLGRDELPASIRVPPETEVRVLIASGLSEGSHRIRLDDSSKGMHGLKGLRVYSPGGSAMIRLLSDVFPSNPSGLVVVQPLSGPKLAWPVSLGIKPLQFSEIFPTSRSWKSLSGTPKRVGDLWVLPIDLNPPQRFYRLSTP